MKIRTNVRVWGSAKPCHWKRKNLSRSDWLFLLLKRSVVYFGSLTGTTNCFYIGFILLFIDKGWVWCTFMLTHWMLFWPPRELLRRVSRVWLIVRKFSGLRSACQPFYKNLNQKIIQMGTVLTYLTLVHTFDCNWWKLTFQNSKFQNLECD